MTNFHNIKLYTGSTFSLKDNQPKPPVITIQNIKGCFVWVKIKKFPYRFLRMGIKFDITVFTDSDRKPQ